MAKIAFIGGGRMAEALLARLDPQNLLVSDISVKRLKHLKNKYQVRVTKDNLEAFRFGEIVVLAVKPQYMPDVLKEIKGGFHSDRFKNKLVISIAAGIPLRYLGKHLPGVPVVRAMPNNPCMVGMGMIALAKNNKVSMERYYQAEELFENVGEVVEVPEKWMDAVTGLSGSGPAFVYMIIEDLAKGGCRMGLPKEEAIRLASQTVMGAAAAVIKTGKLPHELREMVVSPGGTTIEGLKVLEEKKVSHALQGAVVAAAKKSRILSQKWAS